MAESTLLITPNADPRLLELAEAARRFVEQSRAQGTRNTYALHWQYFFRWCRDHDLCAMPARPETLALYLTHHARRGLSPSTLQIAAAAIGKAHALAGHEPPPQKDRLVCETLKGIRRAHGMMQRGRAPLLREDMRRILDSLPDSTAGLRDRALLLFGFLGGFRRSELANMQLRQLRRVREGVIVELFGTKDDTKLVGREVPIPRGSAPDVCPVEALDAWLVRARIAEGHVFRSVDRHGHVKGRMCGRDVALVVKRRARAAGIDITNVSGHSLRAGFVTAAHLSGASLKAIMDQTGHKSADIAMRYIRKADLFKQHPSAGLL